MLNRNSEVCPTFFTCVSFFITNNFQMNKLLQIISAKIFKRNCLNWLLYRITARLNGWQALNKFMSP